MAKGDGMRFNKVGVRYCTTHHGIANEDDRLCDFYDPNGSVHEPPMRACKFRQLGFQTRRR